MTPKTPTTIHVTGLADNCSRRITADVALERPCTECGGTGEITSPQEAWDAWDAAWGEAVKAGDRDAQDRLNAEARDLDPRPCHECGGHGLALTPAGSALVQFARRWLS